MKKLDLLRKIAERISFEYEINWDEWETQDHDEMFKEVTTALKEFESLLDEMENTEDVDVEVYEYVMESLISGYTIMALLERKKKIDEVILAKV